MPNSSEIINKNKKINLVLIHGLGGSKEEFNNIVNKLNKGNFKNRINIIYDTRLDTGFKNLDEQTEEVYSIIQKKIDYSNKNKFIIVGHSQGGPISLLLLDKLQKKNNEIRGLVLVGSPLGGINYVKEFIESNKKEYPTIIHLLEEGVLGFKLENKPQGVLDLMQDNLFPIIDRTNEIIKLNGIATKTVLGIKPKEIEYPASLKSFILTIPNLIKNNLINYHALFNNLLSKISLKTLFDFKKVVSKGNLFSSEEFTGSDKNDLLISKENQKWPHKNKYIEEIVLNDVVHNWKVSVLVSKYEQERIKAELESDILYKTIQDLITNISDLNNYQ
ncbi:MAG: alpha/beta hydrolase [Bacteroidetes bacterium]|nr:alpha/beta hydrolase [Bacteroidota bacterium]